MGAKPMDTLEGRLLVASPRLPDPNFHHSVVLIIQHDENGAFGLILNRATESSVGEIWAMVAGETIDDEAPVHFGGPVGGPLLALHTDPDSAEKEALPGVYFCTQKEHLTQIVTESAGTFRLYSGYSGWGPGQLEGEIQGGGWMTLLARDEFIFGEPEGMWKRAAQEIGEQITRPLVSKVGTPGNPAMN
jgi:putative transcriptional regulator